MKKFFISLLDLIYKKKCYCCGSSKESKALCSKCYNEIDFNPPMVDRIIQCTDVYIAGRYDKYLQKIIRGIKYHNKKELAYYQAKFMYDYFQTLDIDKKFQVIPVPLHPKRQHKRHYNHMVLVAEEFCRLTGFSANYDLIKRVKDTKPQYKLSKSERMQNLQNAFEVYPEYDLSLPILLIDDICTSGATFESIINSLHSKNFTEITCFATTTPIF